MHSAKPHLNRRRVWVRALTGLALLMVVGCGTKSPAPWPWWTEEDSAAVAAEVQAWRDVLKASRFLDGQLAAGWQTGLTSQDSISETGDTLYKFASLLAVSFEPMDSAHADEYQFGVTADTLAMTDTFCEVTYQDSMTGCIARFEYDSLWVVGFRPDTTIDTTASPPETTVVQVVDYVERRGFAAPQLQTKTFAWSARRTLFLRKDTLSDTACYRLRRMTGFASHIPTTEDAPSVSRVILTRVGRVDTFFYSPRADGRGLYNLRPIDSLYTLAPGEDIGLVVTTTTPADTVLDKNHFFAGVDGAWEEITTNARRGEGRVVFADTGYRHLYVEVIPRSNLFYPGTDYSGAVWAIPVRVEANP